MFAFIIAVVLIAICIIPIVGGMQALDSVPQPQQASSEEGNIFYAAIYISIALFIIAVAAAVLLSLFQVIVNPKAAMKGLISFAILVVIFILFYSMSDAASSGSLAQTIEKFGISAVTSKVIGASIALTILIGISSIALIIVMEIRNYFKNS
ncbi:MAG: hypothetical protein EPO28_08465 [Saprospiraceae bacterium]|nr:MAG: hypothetical protein EPO28_08465 [Saprospiraceae bacterium]